MNTDDVTQRIRESGRNVFQMPDEEPLDLDKARKRLRGIPCYVGGVTIDGLPEGLVRRRNPDIEGHGPIDLRDVCTEATVRCMIAPFGGLKYWPAEMIYDFLNPSSLGLGSSSYSDKLKVIPRILTSFFDEFYGGHHRTFYAGNIPDEGSGKIVTDMNETELFWLKTKYSGLDYEVLIDTTKPQTKFLLTNEHKGLFHRLREIHAQENLFKNGPINFVRSIGNGFYIPVLGVTEIIGMMYEPHDFNVKTVLSAKGEEVSDFEGKWHVDYDWLLPKGYWRRDR